MAEVDLEDENDNSVLARLVSTEQDGRDLCLYLYFNWMKLGKDEMEWFMVIKTFKKKTPKNFLKVF